MSGKQAKRRRHEARTAPPPRLRTNAGRQASPKVLIGVLVATAAIGVAVILGVVLTRGSSGPSVPARAHGSLTNALPGATRIDSLFRGIPQSGNVLGSAKAPVTMFEYLDLQCPSCRAFENDALPGLVSRYVRTGKVRIVRRPLAFIGPDSVRARLLAIAAGKQNRQYNLVSLLYANQGAENTGWLSDRLVAAAAGSIPGVEVQQLLAASDSGWAQDEATAFDGLAHAGGVASTPTILVGRSGAKPAVVQLQSAGDGQAVAAAIEQVLR
jgi:protein-disulfide isomerase